MSYKPLLKYIREYIKKSEIKPTEEKDVKHWIGCDDLGGFIQSTSDDWILVCLLSHDYFLNSFLVSNEFIETYRSKNVFDIGDSMLVNSSAEYGYSFSEGRKSYFFETAVKGGPNGSKLYPLFFQRGFDGYKKEERSYYEVLQEYIHFADLHWVKERSSYCVLNEVGDVDERVVIVKENGFSALLFKRNELEKYLLLRQMFICRLFTVTRAMPNVGWDTRPTGTEPEYKCTKDHNSWIKTWPYFGDNLNASYDQVRASDLILPRKTIEEHESPDKKYESFIIYDWKHKKVAECSCNPDAMDSYFADTGKPFQISPAFFKADVLLKYKNEPEKYEVNERSINCRGTWTLQTYDINEEGQVHTYIRYLGYLPYKEQLHWKQYNEEPKGKISDRAVKTDFEAKWSDEYNPLRQIKKHFESFPSLTTPEGPKVIWKPKANLESLLGKIHYVSAGKVSEYKDFLLALTVLVIDGLDTNVLKGLTQTHPDFKADMKSLGCLKLLLLQMKIADAEVEEIMKPLRELQEKRSKYAGHGGAHPEFDLVADCRSILEGIDKSTEKIIQMILKSNEELLSL